ncbi:MAG: GNAT family N-acetyltransferase [Chloroflexi bacterium]|nr:GNAT family N-acetyltransferase [Chloroflexota bacterium]
MATLSPNDLIHNPHVVTKQVYLGAQPVIFRLLLAGDALLLGRYFEGLSAETRRRYGPHPLTADEAERLCATIAVHDTLRFVALLPGETPEIVAYFILVLGVRDNEIARYAGYGEPLDPARDCTFAPSVADAYQGRGLGSLLMPPLLDAAQRLGRRAIVLMAGTQATNARAIAFYRKFGFEHIGDFQTEIANHDMILYL